MDGRLLFDTIAVNRSVEWVCGLSRPWAARAKTVFTATYAKLRTEAPEKVYTDRLPTGLSWPFTCHVVVVAAFMVEPLSQLFITHPPRNRSAEHALLASQRLMSSWVNCFTI